MSADRSFAEVIGAWWFHFKYQVLRVTQYHFSDIPWIGWFAWVIAAYALVARSTRKVNSGASRALLS